ncbi:MAG: anthranilate synthase component II [Bacillota bacterium]
MVLVIDNYDSFTYNLVQYLGEINQQQEIEVYRNDKITISEIKKMSPDQVIISPGPGRPETAGISKKVIKELHEEIPILGVCLGHQCIGQIFGGKIVTGEQIFHGKTSKIYYDQEHSYPLFCGLENPFVATRYHSLIIEPDSLPRELIKIAWTRNEEIMAIAHREFPLYGVQFHPESILTEKGKGILQNFINL